jgi:CBS domain containing-hemolysin-like protein
VGLAEPTVLIALGLALIVALTVATAYFVAAEFAYVAVDRSKLRQAADSGDRAAGRAAKITERLSFMLSGAQLGITVTALLAGYVAEPYLGEGLAGVFGSAGIPSSVAGPAAVAGALIVATVVQMVLGELAPKNLAIARPEALARALSRVTAVYLMVAGPLIKVFDATSNRLLRAVDVEPVEELHDAATAEDLDRIIAEAREQGHLDPELSRLLDHGLDFRTRTAGEVMVPRVDVVTIAADAPLTRVVELTESGHTRFPVTRNGVDDIIGVVALVDVLPVPPAERGDVPVSAVAAAPVFVPESVRLPALLDVLRGARRQMAVVVDEYGGFAGIAHLEDIAEELVGVIRDEDDIPEPDAVAEGDGTWLVPARWRVDEVAEATGIALPDDEVYDTVSGLVLHRLGRIPSVGDRVEVETADVTDPGRVVLEVVTMGRHVPTTVRVRA